jgi:glycosyltransferase involved in cell wall biosynthesis
MLMFPDIDVVIPTLNSGSLLRRCLVQVRNQDYPGKLNLLVVDGGSTDDTVDVARHFGANTFVNPGQYGTGRTGARHFGETVSDAPLVWFVDSDNILIGPKVAMRLAAPFVEDHSIGVAVPLLEMSPEMHGLDRWFALNERAVLHRIASQGDPRENWVRIHDLDYGITNASMMRRDVLTAAGGYDSDVRLLLRLRRMNLAIAAIVPEATYLHLQTNSLAHYYRKITARLDRFGGMDQEAIENYLFDDPRHSRFSSELRRMTIQGIAGAPFVSFRNWLFTGEPDWLWGFSYAAIVACAVATRPRSSLRVMQSFL